MKRDLVVRTFAAIVAFGALLSIAVPARAETLDLVCTFADPYTGQGPSERLSVDLMQRSVTAIWETASSRGPFRASISEATIEWDEPASDEDHASSRHTIDRSTGKVAYEQFWRDLPHGTALNGQCRRATQKF